MSLLSRLCRSDVGLSLSFAKSLSTCLLSFIFCLCFLPTHKEDISMKGQLLWQQDVTCTDENCWLLIFMYYHKFSQKIDLWYLRMIIWPHGAAFLFTIVKLRKLQRCTNIFRSIFGLGRNESGGTKVCLLPLSESSLLLWCLLLFIVVCRQSSSVKTLQKPKQARRFVKGEIDDKTCKLW